MTFSAVRRALMVRCRGESYFLALSMAVIVHTLLYMFVTIHGLTTVQLGESR